MQTKTAPACFDVRKVLTANAMKQRLPRTPRAAYKPKPTMLKHEITAGTQYNNAGVAMFPGQYVREPLQDIRARLAKEFGGYSESSVFGAYMHDNGSVVSEKAITWTIVTDKPIEPACEFIRAALNQESVLLVSTEPKLVKFVV
jgi:hypothetical protein